MEDITGYLFGGGGKAAAFDNLGDKVTGKVVDAQMSQQTSMEDNKPVFWDDGKPKMQLVITLQTALKDDDDDDGVRRVYAKGGSFEVAEGTGKSLKDAIADAMRDAKAKTFEEGATLTVAFTGLAKKKNRGHQAAKLYRAKYEAPVAAVAAEDIFDD